MEPNNEEWIGRVPKNEPWTAGMVSESELGTEGCLPESKDWNAGMVPKSEAWSAMSELKKKVVFTILVY